MIELHYVHAIEDNLKVTVAKIFRVVVLLLTTVYNCIIVHLLQFMALAICCHLAIL